LLIFSHGNSFSASTYGVMLRDLQRRGYQVEAIEKFGHDPRYPVSSNWPISPRKNPISRARGPTSSGIPLAVF